MAIAHRAVAAEDGRSGRPNGVEMPRLRPFVMCADDFGLSQAVDAGILALVAAGRLSATGCMPTGPAFAADADRLRGFADRIDIGLHFALTDLPPLAPIASLDRDGRPQSLRRVLARALSGGIDHHEITAEIGRQVDRFRAAIGRDPDFVDGHQHVHVLPGVRRGLFAAFDQGLLDRRRTWVRDCRESPRAIVARGVEAPKALFIATLSAGLAAAARRRGITVNQGFGGITGFHPQAVAAVYPKFLTRLGRRPLVMCHPADPAAPADPRDPIDRARRAEYLYFAGEGFARDLAAAGLVPARMAAVAASGEGA
jgi:predicted glycoside hydrolase/deacetylase ChbG (UPF0249 family)